MSDLFPNWGKEVKESLSGFFWPILIGMLVGGLLGLYGRAHCQTKDAPAVVSKGDTVVVQWTRPFEDILGNPISADNLAYKGEIKEDEGLWFTIFSDLQPDGSGDVLQFTKMTVNLDFGLHSVRVFARKVDPVTEYSLPSNEAWFKVVDLQSPPKKVSIELLIK